MRLLEEVHEVYDVLLSCVETYEWVSPGATGLLRLWMLQVGDLEKKAQLTQVESFGAFCFGSSPSA